jgi:hypothetical protein
MYSLLSKHFIMGESSDSGRRRGSSEVAQTPEVLLMGEIRDAAGSTLINAGALLDPETAFIVDPEADETVAFSDNPPLIENTPGNEAQVAKAIWFLRDQFIQAITVAITHYGDAAPDTIIAAWRGVQQHVIQQEWLTCEDISRVETEIKKAVAITEHGLKTNKKPPLKRKSKKLSRSSRAA